MELGWAGKKRLKKYRARDVPSLGLEGSMAKAAIGTRGFLLMLPTSQADVLPQENIAAVDSKRQHQWLRFLWE